LVERNETAIIAICRALLSTSSAVRGMREALVEWGLLSLVVEIAVRNEEPAFYDQVLSAIRSTRAALSLVEGEDKQARATPSAPTTTDTKDTTK